jgi:hypothetical protein
VSKRFVHYHKVHANNTIARSKSGPLPTSSPIQLTKRRLEYPMNERDGKKKKTQDFVSARPHPHMLQDARPPGSVAGSRVRDARRPAVQPPALLRG